MEKSPNNERMDEEKKRRIRELRTAGHTRQEIADRLGLTWHQVVHYLYKEKILIRTKRTAEEKEKIMQLLRQEKFSDSQIARQCNISESVVGEMRRMMGITEEQSKTIMQLFRRGSSRTDIMREVDVSGDAVDIVVKKYGQSFVARDKLPISQKQKRQIFACIEKGHSRQRILQKFCLSEATLEALLRQNENSYRERCRQSYQQRRDTALKLAKQGLAWEEIAKQLKISRKRLSQIVQMTSQELISPEERLLANAETAAQHGNVERGRRRSARLSAKQSGNPGNDRRYSGYSNDDTSSSEDAHSSSSENSEKSVEAVNKEKPADKAVTLVKKLKVGQIAEEKMQRVCELRNAGCTRQEIAEREGVKVSTVKHILKKKKLAIRRKQTPEQTTQVKELIRQGKLSDAEIGRRLKMCGTVVGKMRRMLGVTAEQKKRILRLFDGGSSRTEIMREVGVEAEAVDAVLKSVGQSFAARDKLPISQKQKKEILSCFEKGDTKADIAEKFNLSESILEALLRQNENSFRERRHQNYQQKRTAARQLRAEGLSLRAIVKRLKIGLDTAGKMLKTASDDDDDDEGDQLVQAAPANEDDANDVAHVFRRSARLKAMHPGDPGSQHGRTDCPGLKPSSSHDRVTTAAPNINATAGNSEGEAATITPQEISPAVLDPDLRENQAESTADTDRLLSPSDEGSNIAPPRQHINDAVTVNPSPMAPNVEYPQQLSAPLDEDIPTLPCERTPPTNECSLDAISQQHVAAASNDQPTSTAGSRVLQPCDSSPEIQCIETHSEPTNNTPITVSNQILPEQETRTDGSNSPFRALQAVVRKLRQQGCPYEAITRRIEACFRSAATASRDDERPDNTCSEISPSNRLPAAQAATAARDPDTSAITPANPLYHVEAEDADADQHRTGSDADPVIAAPCQTSPGPEPMQNEECQPPDFRSESEPATSAEVEERLSSPSPNGSCNAGTLSPGSENLSAETGGILCIDDGQEDTLQRGEAEQPAINRGISLPLNSSASREFDSVVSGRVSVIVRCGRLRGLTSTEGDSADTGSGQHIDAALNHHSTNVTGRPRSPANAESETSPEPHCESPSTLISNTLTALPEPSSQEPDTGADRESGHGEIQSLLGELPQQGCSHEAVNLVACSPSDAISTGDGGGSDTGLGSHHEEMPPMDQLINTESSGFCDLSTPVNASCRLEDNPAHAGQPRPDSAADPDIAAPIVAASRPESISSNDHHPTIHTSEDIPEMGANTGTITLPLPSSEIPLVPNSSSVPTPCTGTTCETGSLPPANAVVNSGDGARYQCRICRFSCEDEAAFLLHLADAEHARLFAAGDFLYCTGCKFKTRKPATMGQHIVKYQSQRTLQTSNMHSVSSCASSC
ncbi:uncharacterized protein LOC129600931 [Paramacrobiotus metropolitanus]|uniref:uncharacterized protein LOC129600931 n=1 Tax=Paramacrobiotus metropolitanus TaxID=2943436 RepID=UPI002445AD4D|nr:uncharacterized protein LOC129600931 [Paramacrobiotus metropolitanus]XP_055355586.1 uncharacterized protein LOC129600931 [Paramacrobiotus metropolitanus]XP_055355587.1 uncharacterized protein LOC129600931 [Paramacrobiotus metropolitanus]